MISTTKINNSDNLIDFLINRANEKGDSVAFSFLKNGIDVDSQISYASLNNYAKKIGAILQSYNYENERALLIYPSSLEYIKALFGCFYSRVIAVPVFPPRLNRSLGRIISIIKDSKAKVVLTNSDLLEKIGYAFEQDENLSNLHWISTDNIGADSENNWIRPEIKPNDAAYLQYTSGSTGDPKGVIITHKNVLHNSEYIHQIHNTGEKSISITWLPIYHDMGLIDGIFQPLYAGFTGYIMPPVAFLQRPMCWLEAITKYKATHCGGPNFAFDLCVEKAQKEDINKLDLSSWKNAYLGAEKIWKETLDSFSEKFKCCGFDPSAFHPCYGLAEATLVATGGGYGNSLKCYNPNGNGGVLDKYSNEPSRKTTSVFVGNGRAFNDMKVKIVNPDSFIECKEKEVGEIWISGPSVAKGYWDKEELTKEIFQREIKGVGKEQYLRTGDLGFINKKALFFTGRLKELMIIRGQNFYPYDFEKIIENSDEALKANSCAVVSIYIEHQEKIIVLQEIKRTFIRKYNLEQISSKIRKLVWNEFQLQIYDVVLLKTNTLPKTSSGKIQRNLCKKLYVQNNLDVLGNHIIERK